MAACPPHQRTRALQVLVRDNNVDQALRVLKKKMQREGVFREPHKQPRHGPLSRSRSRSYRGGFFAFRSPTRDPGSRSRRARPLAFALRYNSTSRLDQGEGFFFVVVALVWAGALVLALASLSAASLASRSDLSRAVFTSTARA